VYLIDLLRLKTVRKAIGMSGSQLANRLGVTKGRVSQAESAELSGSATLKSMHSMAQAMNCRFVYAVFISQLSDYCLTSN
jgi:predicted DNA-binding mobile mystery protein A